MNDQIRIDINEAWCKGCEICVEVCPREVLAMQDFVARVVKLEECTGCMLCEQLCPDFAIVIHAPKKSKKTAA